MECKNLKRYCFYFSKLHDFLTRVKLKFFFKKEMSEVTIKIPIIELDSKIKVDPNQSVSSFVKDLSKRFKTEPGRISIFVG